MTAKTTFTATDPRGLVHKRTSQSRTYSHAVFARPSYEHAVANAQHKDWAKTEGSNFAYYLRIAGGRDAYPTKNYRAMHADKWSAAEIAEEQVRVDAENAKRVANAQARVEGHTLESYLAAQQAERLANVEAARVAGKYDSFVCLGWCGRRDLAEKQAAANRGKYAEVIVAAAFELPAKTKEVAR